MQISNVEELKAWIAAGGVPDYLYFWGHTPAQPQVPDKSCLSQWFPSPFSLAGVTYATAEHYMMAQKAALFGDTAVQARIVAAGRPSEVKKLGREVANFDAKVWEAARAGIVFDGNFAKFSQKAAQVFAGHGRTRHRRSQSRRPYLGRGLGVGQSAYPGPRHLGRLEPAGF